MAKQRNLSDAEIGIVKAMLRKGWRNDVIHYYFNKPDRLISSGRITEIKNGKYGASVEEAQPDTPDDLLIDPCESDRARHRRNERPSLRDRKGQYAERPDRNAQIGGRGLTIRLEESSGIRRPASSATPS